MDYPSLVHHYGYAAIVLGTFFEGEAVLVLGGLAAQEGYLDLRVVLACGAMGVLASDQVCFVLGRCCGRRLLARFPRLQPRVGAALRMVERHQAWLAAGFQFIPGTSTVTPIAFGMSAIGAWRFLALDLAGIAAWTLAFVLGGFAAGSALARAWTDFGRHEWLIACATLGAGLAAWLVRRWRSHVEVPALSGTRPTDSAT